jgi:hypothetical protein
LGENLRESRGLERRRKRKVILGIKMERSRGWAEIRFRTGETWTEDNMSAPVHISISATSSPLSRSRTYLFNK